MRILDRRDQLSVLHDQRHALVLERLRGLKQPHRGALGALEHGAGRDRDAELEPEVHGECLEVDHAVLDEHRPEARTVARLEAERAPQLSLGEPAVAHEHLPELHLPAKVPRTCYRNGMRAWLLAVAAVGCSSKSEPTPPVPSPSPIPVAPEPPQVAPPDFPEGTRSLELRRTVGVRLEPGDDARRIGTVAVDTRVAWIQVAKGKGCDKPWIEIRPRGWICGEYVEPSKKPPYGQEVPHLERGEIVPGIYGKVTAPNSMTYVLQKPDKAEAKKDAKKDARKDAKRDPRRAAARKDPKSSEGRRPITPNQDDGEPTARAAPLRMVEGKPLVGSVNVRQYEEVTVGGRQYWKVDKKDSEYVLKLAITPHRPSLFGGTRLGDDTGVALPIAFVWPRFGAQLALTTNKAVGGGVNRQIASRLPLAILETATDKAGKPSAYRIGPSEWIAALDVRMFQPAPPPPMLEPGERWIDVDVDDQILVAYEGELPVYATMVTSGGTTTPTEPGVYRMWLKESEAAMKGPNGEAHDS